MGITVIDTCQYKNKKKAPKALITKGRDGTDLACWRFFTHTKQNKNTCHVPLCVST